MNPELEARKPFRLFRTSGCKWCSCIRADHLELDGSGPCGRCGECDSFADRHEDIGQRRTTSAMRTMGAMLGYDIPDDDPEIEQVAELLHRSIYARQVNNDAKLLETAWAREDPQNKAFFRNIVRDMIENRRAFET